LAVFRSNKHIYAQLIDDVQGLTLVSAGSTEGETRKSVSNGGNVAAAKEVGRLIAERAKQKGLTAVLFDRGGYIYHGRVRALAESAREAGLQF
jgi:large subunit ribosomal protein L18